MTDIHSKPQWVRLINVKTSAVTLFDLHNNSIFYLLTQWLTIYKNVHVGPISLVIFSIMIQIS